MPVQIKDLKNDLRIQWETSQENAGQSGNDDKWFASINVIFDSDPNPNSHPETTNRDFDLVILRESNNYSPTDLKDRPPYNQNEEANGRYWFFARKEDGSLQRFSVERDGQRYDYAIRYKFHNYGDNRPTTDTDKNDKVHVKFFPLSRDADSILPNDQMMPFDHYLKDFVDASKDYLPYVEDELNEWEICLAKARIAVDNLWIKSIAAGYEVYRTNSDQNLILRNDQFKVVLD
ncbi:MAG: hypothetical protein AAF383_20435 [Cyanobacteria bacterium P01_A01_bin.83]